MKTEVVFHELFFIFLPWMAAFSDIFRRLSKRVGPIMVEAVASRSRTAKVPPMMEMAATVEAQKPAK